MGYQVGAFFILSVKKIIRIRQRNIRKVQKSIKNGKFVGKNRQKTIKKFIYNANWFILSKMFSVCNFK